jgi:NAD(P)-dependent dehydrogenase (short-subunit alcohol dehydrogenase family)
MADGTIAVIGSTRGTGLEVMRALLAAGRPAVAVARDVDKARGLLPGAQVVRGDVTRHETLEAAIQPDWAGIVFTVDITGGIGGRGMFAPREKIRAVMYGGVVNAVEAARQRGFRGRFVLLSTIGLAVPSLAITLLDRAKPGLRQHSVDKGEYLKGSGLDWCIAKAGMLGNDPASDRTLAIGTTEVALTMGRKIGRADLAKVLIACVDEPAASRREFSVFYAPQGRGETPQTIAAKLRTLN